MYPNLPNGLPRGLQARPFDLLSLLEAYTTGLPGLAAPNPTVTAHALTPGFTTYAYTVTAIAAFGTTAQMCSTASPTVQVINQASLNNAAYNQINWGPVRDAAGYVVTRVTGGPNQGVIAVVSAGAILDCEPAGALVQPSFPLLPPFEIHDIGLTVLGSV